MGLPAGPGSMRARATTRPQTSTKISATTKMNRLLSRNALVTSHHFSLHQRQEEKGFPHGRIIGENETNEGQRHEAEAAPAKGEPGGIAGLRRGNAHFDEIVPGKRVRSRRLIFSAP